MAETRRQFDQQFRAGAVRIVRETGKPIVQVAKDLGINPGTSANWVKRDRVASGPSDSRLAESERERVARAALGRTPSLAMERDVLKC